MKKRICLILSLMLIVTAITSVTASAKVIRTERQVLLMKKGLSAEDACYCSAIIYLSKSNYIDAVLYKYYDLGDWEKVAEHYEISLEDFYKRADAEQNSFTIELSDDIYEEMKAEGMTDEECRWFVIDARNVGVNAEDAWAGHLEGKTANEIARERTEIKNAKSALGVSLAEGKITQKEYFAQMAELDPEMSMSDLITYASEIRKQLMVTLKVATGISDEEIALAQKAGMTDFFAICRLKAAELATNLTYTQMLELVVKGATVDEVVEANISQEKIAPYMNKGNIDPDLELNER